MPRIFTTRRRRRSGPYWSTTCSSWTTPWAMLCSCTLSYSALRSSSSSTVQPRLAKEALEGQHLPPVTQRILRQQPHLGQAVEHHAQRLQALDGRHDAAGGLAQFDLGRVQDGLLGRRTEPFLGDQLEHLDAFQRPAVRRGHRAQFRRGFGQGDVQALLPVLDAASQELQPKRRLARAGGALDQVQVIGRKSATQDVVEAGHAGRGSFLFRNVDALGCLSHVGGCQPRIVEVRPAKGCSPFPTHRSRKPPGGTSQRPGQQRCGG